MRQANVLAGLAVLTLAGGGCIATRPYVRTQVQSSEAGTQERVDSVEQRVGTVERDLVEEKTRRLSLEAGLVEVRRMTEDTARQADRTRELATDSHELAARADTAARDALQTVASLPASKTTEPAADSPASSTPQPPAGPPASKTPQLAGGPPETFVIHFAFADSRLDNSSRMTLTKALKRLQQNPALVVKIEGYTDSAGSARINVKLSQRRADEVWRFLVGNGIKRNRIETQAMGEARPVASNDSPGGRDQNRRVSVTLLSSPGL
jgi:outer membrane protein OmpA-like peptidoglycan-associated protein